MSIVLHTTLETLSLGDRYTLSQALQISEESYGDWLPRVEQKLLLMRELETGVEPRSEDDALWRERVQIAGVELCESTSACRARLQTWQSECRARLRQLDIGANCSVQIGKSRFFRR
ncbi:MAG: hypothetical protein ACYCYO_00475 [Bacilli bacterium]